MENFNALIVDDEEYSRSSLYFLLQDNCPNVKVINISKSVKEAQNFILENKVDLVFLDIAMPRENGFVLIPLLQEKKIMVVFTTAFDQYALKAIKASAVDYLLKPIDISELKMAVEKAFTIYKLSLLHHQYHDYSKTLSTLAENLEQKSKEIKKLTIASTSGFKIIILTDIIYLEADSNYCIFHLISGEKVVASKTLKDYEEILTENNFIRIHKSHIINLIYLKEFKNNNGLNVKLVNDITIQVSRRRMSEFLEKVKKVNLKGK
ncbi:LytR/AlgR family response regulator transcription factor [Pedobacter cryophilus]|uniref:Response regulator transcription factor n=1 Tax=Pedobacter cryophilus TaxID=2571271 RepID=A0A4U1BYK3_9SPHI|nr:LytTR family DNA-binding domain-containing protein [Pedobacter cryophilus]TKB97815.1 response regulator transcription factor [Pedobacter cryophilus]